MPISESMTLPVSSQEIKNHKTYNVGSKVEFFVIVKRF